MTKRVLTLTVEQIDEIGRCVGMRLDQSKEESGSGDMRPPKTASGYDEWMRLASLCECVGDQLEEQRGREG